MKKIVIIAFLIVSAKAYAQKDTIGLNMPYIEKKVVYEGIVQVPGKSKSVLYKNSKQWFVDYFKNSKDVIQSDDKEDGRLVGKATIVVSMNGGLMSGIYNEQLTVQIDCKDERFRYRIYDMSLSQPKENLKEFGGLSTGGFTFTPEDLMENLLSNKKKHFTKSYSKKLLSFINSTNLELISSIQKSIPDVNGESDF